ncbi:MAG: DUF2878 domain-containing protein [Woeseiaceae bacterium]|nr:DUF2878 domain-containing protein [Woeseiaceae bacterium]
MGMLVNIAAFQVGWFSSVIGGAQQMPWLGPLAALIVLSIHLYIARQPSREIVLIVCAAALGAAFDSALLAAGWVQYSSGLFSDYVAPYWIITMWMLFATTLNVSLRWMRTRPLVASVFGLIGGPLSYIAGQKLGGVVLVNEVAALAALGIGWAIFMPLLLWLSKNFDGIEPQPATVPKAA